MSFELLTTKLNIPPPPTKHIPRPQLIEKLNQGLDHELTLISAPAGYGKTTLLSSWIHHQPTGSDSRKVTWLSLEERDNDPVRFLAYVIKAFQRICPDIGNSVLTMIQAPQPPPVETSLTTLINEIAEIESDFILILDDYHFIQHLSIHQQLGFIVENRPPIMHLVVASREDPPLPLPRLRARGQLVEIRQDDLRFSTRECMQFLKLVAGLDFSTAEIEALERRTEGWPAGLQLAGVAMQSLMRTSQSGTLHSFIQSFTGSNRYILDYLIEEVFERQSGNMQEFLLQTSILEQYSASLCNAVTGRSDSQEILNYLEQANLFVHPLDQSRGWFRYHRLFRELLRSRLSRSDPDLEPDLHKRACRWYRDNDFSNQAIHHALASEEWDEAVSLIVLAAEGAIQKGQFGTMDHWLEALPVEIIQSSLQLATFKGWISLMMGDIETAGVYTQRANALISPDSSPEIHGLLIVLDATLALSRGDFASTFELSQAFLSLPADSQEPMLRGMALNNLAQAQLMVGDLPAATGTYHEMVRLNLQASPSPASISAEVNLAWLLHQGGNRLEALRRCQQILQRCVDQRGRETPLAGYAHGPMGMLYYESNQFDLAEQHLHKALEFGEQLGPGSGIPVSARIALVRIQQARGDFNAAFETLAEIRTLGAQLNIPYVEFVILGVEAELQLKQGNFNAVEAWAQGSGLSPNDIPNHLREDEYFTLTRLLLAQKRFQEAGTLLDNFEGYAQSSERRRSLISIYILRALSHQAQARNERAQSYLEMALDLAAPEDYRRAFLDEGQALIEILPSVRACKLDFVDQLLADARSALHLLEKPTPDHMLVDPLSDRELEVLKLVAGGLSNREIADRLVISIGTVKTHVHHIYGKLEVRGRTQAVARAREINLID